MIDARRVHPGGAGGRDELLPANDQTQAALDQVGERFVIIMAMHIVQKPILPRESS